jgi:hypothetical protein
MNVANSKKNSPLQNTGFEWAGVAARIRRSGGASRSGRRSALLGVLTSVYANTSRSTSPRATAADTRSGTASDRS